MEKTREQQAIAAYLKLLSAKDCDKTLLNKREVLLNALAPSLAIKENTTNDYRDVIEQFVETLPAEEWSGFLSITREFFPFWMADIKAISLLNAEDGFNVSLDNWVPTTIPLDTLWQTIDQEKFSTAESWAIKSYSKALRDENASQELIATRLKMAKILVVRLRDAPIHQTNAYRIAVDATTPLFNLKSTRQLFLVVVREFFYFWSGNPEAKDHILKPNRASIL